MRICFVGDLQLEAGANLGNGQPYGPGSRFADQEAILDRVRDIAGTCEVTVMLGDLFHSPAPKPWSILALQKFIRELDHVVVVTGNHDVRSASLPSVTQVFADQARVFTRPGITWVDWGFPVVFAALPWAPMSRLAAGREDISHANLKAVATDALVQSAQVLRMRCAEQHPEALPILLGHWSVSGSTLPGGGQVADLVDEVVLPWEELDSLGFKLAAFGHIHSTQVIAKVLAQTPMFYAGSVMTNDFGEAGVPHGVWVYDTEADDLRFHPIEDRKFITVDYTSPEVGWDAFGYGAVVEGAVYRIRYTTTEDEPVDEGKLRAFLLERGASRVFIQGTVERTSRARVEVADESVGPDEGLELWLAANEVSGAPAATLRVKHLEYAERVR